MVKIIWTHVVKPQQLETNHHGLFMTLNYLVVGLIVLAMIILAFFADRSNKRKEALQKIITLLNAFDDLHSQVNLLESYLDIRDLMFSYNIQPHEVGYASYKKIYESAYNTLRHRLNKAKDEMKNAKDVYEDQVLQGNILHIEEFVNTLDYWTGKVLYLGEDLKELGTFMESSVQSDSEQGLITVTTN
jgi:lipopolysaccharide biosynthesis regulator YciM